MKQLKTLKAVYSYMFPEVRNAILETIIPDRPFNGYPGNYGFNEFLSQFMKSPDEMDAMHEPILKKWVKLHKRVLPGIQKFKFSYPTAGSEEGIREFMTYLLAKGVTEIYVLKGEYEGYSEVAMTRLVTIRPDFPKDRLYCGIKVYHVSEEEAFNVKGKWFFLSNPSARDGCVINPLLVKRICDNNKVFYDLAYLDSVDPAKVFDLSHFNIRAVVMSFSKPYGLFYWRFGALFSREAVPSLYGNKWFKVVPAMLVADKIMDTINPGYMYCKYRNIQEQIVLHLRHEFKLPFRCGDALLISYIRGDSIKGISKAKQELINPFKRGDDYRFCLKPYYEEWERRESLK